MTNNSPKKIDEIQAKGGRTVKGMTTVLGVSIALAVILGAVTLMIFAAI